MVLSFMVVLALGWFFLGSPEAPKTGTEVTETPAESGPNQEDGNEAMSSLEDSFGGKETPIPVSAEPTVRGELVQKITAQGQVFSYQKADIVCEVSGKLMELNVQDGQHVKKGDLLAKIDDRPFELAYKETQAKYLSAMADFLVYEQTLTDIENQNKDSSGKRDDLKKQFEAGEISQENYRQKSFILDLESIKSGGRRSEVVAARTLDQAAVQRDKAQLDLEKCNVIAPFDGVIFDVSVTPGELVSNNTKLFHLMNLENLVVKVRVLESEIGQVRKGREAEIEFPALSDLGKIKGIVKAVSPYVNSDDKTIETILTIVNPQERIRPGMFAEVHLDAAVFEDQIMVPKTAILPRDDRKVVFVVDKDNRASWIYVQTGPENEEYVAITEGKLSEGDMVLTDNHFTMGHGTLVNVIKK